MQMAPRFLCIYLCTVDGVAFYWHTADQFLQGYSPMFPRGWPYLTLRREDVHEARRVGKAVSVLRRDHHIDAPAIYAERARLS